MKFAIIFDLDGTLIDTPSGIIETISQVLKSQNLFVPDRSVIKATIGLPLEQAFSHLMQITQDDIDLKNAVKKYQTLFKEIVLPNAKNLVFPWVIEGLKKLRNEQFSIAIATSKIYQSAETLLKAAELWDNFDFILGADNVAFPKPHPEMGQIILKKLAVCEMNAVMVGDTTHDIKMANALGIPSIAVSYGVHDISTLQTVNPTWVVHSFSDVIKVCIKNKNALIECNNLHCVV